MTLTPRASRTPVLLVLLCACEVTGPLVPNKPPTSTTAGTTTDGDTEGGSDTSTSTGSDTSTGGPSTDS